MRETGESEIRERETGERDGRDRKEEGVNEEMDARRLYTGLTRWAGIKKARHLQPEEIEEQNRGPHR